MALTKILYSCPLTQYIHTFLNRMGSQDLWKLFDLFFYISFLLHCKLFDLLNYDFFLEYLYFVCFFFVQHKKHSYLGTSFLKNVWLELYKENKVFFSYLKKAAYFYFRFFFVTHTSKRNSKKDLNSFVGANIKTSICYIRK